MIEQIQLNNEKMIQQMQMNIEENKKIWTVISKSEEQIEKLSNNIRDLLDVTRTNQRAILKIIENKQNN
jgi:hypothetical protein